MRQTLFRIPLDGRWQITEDFSVPGFGLIGVPMALLFFLPLLSDTQQGEPLTLSAFQQRVDDGNGRPQALTIELEVAQIALSSFFRIF